MTQKRQVSRGRGIRATGQLRLDRGKIRQNLQGNRGRRRWNSTGHQGGGLNVGDIGGSLRKPPRPGFSGKGAGGIRVAGIVGKWGGVRKWEGGGSGVRLRESVADSVWEWRK